MSVAKAAVATPSDDGLLAVTRQVRQDRAVFGTFQIEKRDRRFGPLWERVWCRIRREPFKRLRKQLLEKMGHFEA